MEDRHDDDDGHGAGSLDAPADAIIDPALDPSLVGSGGESTNQPSQRSQLPSASAGHELLALLDDETGHATFDGNSTANATNQAFWDAMPLGDTLHGQDRQTSTSSHTPTMEDLHAVMSHDTDPHAYGHPDDSAHYDPFDPPQQMNSVNGMQQGHNQRQSHLAEGHRDSHASHQSQRHHPNQRQDAPPSQPLTYVPAPTPGRDLLHSVAAPQPPRSPASRKETHKMVERKRREVITKGINEIAELLPEPEKNKSLILGKAVDYIRQLQKTAVADHEKWAMERTMVAQAMSDLRAMLAEERSKRRELEQTLHGIGRSAGLSGYGDIALDIPAPLTNSESADDRSNDKRGPDEEASDSSRPSKRPCVD